MVAGMLHQAGYFLGDRLYSAGLNSNPKGFFECKEINKINEEILSHYGNNLYSFLVKRILKKNPLSSPGKNQRWLISIPARVDISISNPSTEARIRAAIRKESFCYKDPRFSYTLPVWQPFLKPNTGFICLFREPDLTVESIIKECKSRDYLSDLHINRRLAYRVWANIYSHILLKNKDIFNQFFFVHYNQIHNGTAISSLSDFLNVDLKVDFIDKNLKRTQLHSPIPQYVKEIYLRLCDLANL
jgi:hypothetical protein